MKATRLAAFGSLVALVALTACGGGARATSVPSAHDNGAGAPRSMNDHARRITERLSAASAESVQTHIDKEAAKGARVFRVEQVAVYDSATHTSYVAPRDQVRQTSTETVIFPGPHEIVLSPGAKVSPIASYGYIFRHGTEHDPDPSYHAVRIR